MLRRKKVVGATDGDGHSGHREFDDVHQIS